tara:strand:+ start:1944 stop:2144 length:201 start_codon:yes stop_codon:yes gene_type:complete
MSIDCIYSKTERMIARSVRNEVAVDTFTIGEMMDWEIYCSNADNGFGGDITTGKRLPSLAEWVNRK